MQNANRAVEEVRERIRALKTGKSQEIEGFLQLLDVSFPVVLLGRNGTEEDPEDLRLLNQGETEKLERLVRRIPPGQATSPQSVKC